MSVVKPWMFGSPAPETSHSLAGLPGFEFSQTISLATGASQGPAAACPAAGPISTASAMTGGASRRLTAREEPEFRACPSKDDARLRTTLAIPLVSRHA